MLALLVLEVFFTLMLLREEYDRDWYTVYDVVYTMLYPMSLLTMLAANILYLRKPRAGGRA